MGEFDVIRIGKSISQEKTRTIYYYVEFERDMNGKVANEVKLYKAKRKLLEVDPKTANTKFSQKTEVLIYHV